MGLISDKYPNGIDERGREVADPRPAAPTVRRERAQGLADQMRSVVRQMQYEAEMAQRDSEDDDRDFDVEDENFPKSPHELFMESPEFDVLMEDLSKFANKRKAAGSETYVEKVEVPKKGKTEKAAPEPKAGTE